MRGLWWAELRATAALALPIIAGQLCAMGQGMVDVLLAGHINAHVLAAVSIGASVWGLAFMAALGMSYALPPAVAQLVGAGRREATGAVFRQALWLALAVGLALLAAVRWVGPEVVRASGVAPSLQPDAAAFLRAISFGAPALSLFLTCRSFSEGLSRPGVSMVMGLLGLLLLAPIGYVLMYGRLGLPMLGARGSGIATATVLWLQLAAFATVLGRSRRYRGTGWGLGRRGPDARAIAGLLRVGLPMTLSQLLESSLFTAAALVIGGFGEAAAAGHQIAISVAAVSFMVPLGVALATTVRVGNAAGRGERVAVRRAGFCGMALAMALQAASSALLLGAPAAVAGLYTGDAAVVARAATLLPLAGVFQFSDALQVAAMGALRGLKDVRVPVLMTAFAYWAVGMPVGLWLAYRAGMQAPGMWIGLIAALSVVAGLLSWRFARITSPGSPGGRPLPRPGSARSGRADLAAGPLLLVKSGGEAAMAEWRHWFAQFAPDLELRWWDDPAVDPAQVAYAFVWEPDPGRLAAMPNLRLVCSDGAGVGHVTRDASLPPGLRIVRLVTAEAAQLMAEYVALACLALLRDLPRALSNQRAGVWQEFSVPRTARETRVGLMGLGRVAAATPGALSGVGFRLAGWSATRRALPGMECFAGEGEFRAFLAASDIVVNLLPETAATVGVLRAETLAWLPKGAGLVNAGRGSHLLLPDLLAALDTGQVGGAVLDVFDPEPLPPGSPLWSHPRVIVTAHGAAFGSRRGRAAYVADIVARDRRGEAVPNLFNRTLGY